MARTYELLRSPTDDTADGVVIVSDVAEQPTMQHLDTPGSGVWRYWFRAADDGVPLPWVGPTDPVDVVNLDEEYARPVGWRNFTPLDVSAGGDFVLRNDTDYLIEAQQVTGKWVRLRGGRKVVVMGLTVHQDQPWSAIQAASEMNSTGLELQENPFDPSHASSGGALQADAECYIEGFLATGPRLTQGLRLNCLRDVRLRNTHVAPVRFKNCDHRDGTNGLTTNHPDIVQTYNNGFKSLLIDGLTGYTGYQGIFLRGSSPSTKPVTLRNIDVHAIEFASEEQDGQTRDYAGHRILSNVDGHPWTVENVWVEHHPNNGWAPPSGFQRVRYWSGSAYVDEPPGGVGQGTDAIFPAGFSTGTDDTGAYAEWAGVGRVYFGVPGEFVPAGSVGAAYLQGTVV